MKDFQDNTTNEPTEAEIEDQRTAEVNDLLDRSHISCEDVEDVAGKYVCKNGLCNEFDVQYPVYFFDKGPDGLICLTCRDTVYAVGSPEAKPSGAKVTERRYTGASLEQLSMIGSLAQAKHVSEVIECRKVMQCEFSELSPTTADVFIQHLQNLPSAVAKPETAPSPVPPVAPAPTADGRLVEQAAVETAERIVPEMGEVLKKYEPTAIAFGFPPAVDLLIDKAKLDPEQTTVLLSQFNKLFSMIGQFRSRVKAIHIDSVNDTEAIKEAKECHLAIRNERLNAEKRKKIVKDPYLKPCQLIDGVFKIWIDETDPIEKEALAKAKYVENLEKAEKERIRMTREEQLLPFVENVKSFNLHPDVMTDEAFETILATQKELFASREADRKRQDEERQRDEDDAAAERVRIRRQSDRARTLSELGFVRDAAADSNRYILDGLSVYDVEIVNDTEPVWNTKISDLTPKAEAARVEAERIRRDGESALRARQDAERAEQDAAFRAEREREASLLAPDKIKLGRLADAINAIEFFETDNEKIIEILSTVKADLYNTEAKLRSQIERLP